MFSNDGGLWNVWKRMGVLSRGAGNMIRIFQCGKHRFYINRIRCPVVLLLMLSEGRIAFLCDEEKAIICDFLCQCPRTGNHHFYGAVQPAFRHEEPVSMP